MKSKKSKKDLLLNGILKENPVLVLMLGTCPSLAVSDSVSKALGMGIATLVVLVCSNFLISLLRNIIPKKVSIPAYIIIIATFVSIVELALQVFPQTYNLYLELGVYIPLITVNCIIFGRAEAFAGKNSVLDSVVDGFAMGLGFIGALVGISSIREILGKGTWMGMGPKLTYFQPITFFVQPYGGFFVYGLVIAIVVWLTKGKRPNRDMLTCGGCTSTTCSVKEGNS